MADGVELRASDVAELRVRAVSRSPARPDGKLVLYWMTAARRLGWNFALDRAVEWAAELRRPLVVVEVLCCGGRWASDRHHRLVLAGMAEHAEYLAGKAPRYWPLVEAEPGQARRLLERLGERACVVVGDDHPIAGPADVEPAAARLPVRAELVDSNGLLPLGAAADVFSTAYALRRFLQKTLRDWLLDRPRPRPLARLKLPRLRSLPRDLLERWPPAGKRLLAGDAAALGGLPIDHSVPPVETTGGPAAGRRRLKAFLAKRLARYASERNEPEAEATSGLSPYLRHGHVSAFEVFDLLARQEGWTPDRLAAKATGNREGWWGMGEPAEAFLDELVTWRELGYNMCAKRDDFDRYESLPGWALETLRQHAGDRRQYVYSFDQLDAAQTHDPLWNAAQVQLRREGVIHNYLRMLWGKKILEWTASPQEAAEVMIELNNRYALDGQDPNSYSGIFWVLGRYDRPWGPERPVFGKVRYMSSENTARKLRVDGYIARYRPDGSDA